MKTNLNIKNKLTQIIKITIFLLITMIRSVYATNDPLTTINNLSDMIFTIVERIGQILLIFSLVQFGLSFKSQDPTQKSNSVMGIVGSLIIIGAKIIISKITG